MTPRAQFKAFLPLTSREKDVLRLLALGLTYAQIAARLDVSRNTVSTHIKKLYRKLRVNSARAAIWRALTYRLLIEEERPN